MRGPRLLRLLLPFPVALLLVGCAIPQESAPTTPPPQPEFPLLLTDDEGVTMELEEAPKRIVTWSPGITEILFALDRGEEIVGVAGDADDVPAQARSIERVAGPGGNPDVDRILGLRPDLVLDGFGGDPGWRDALRERGVIVFSVSTRTVDDLLHDIQTIGRVAGAPEEADELVGEMATAIADVDDRAEEGGPVSCYARTGTPGPNLPVAPDSLEHDVLVTAGCRPVNDSAKADRVFEIDRDLIARPGPRIVDGLEAVAEALYGPPE